MCIWKIVVTKSYRLNDEIRDFVLHHGVGYVLCEEPPFVVALFIQKSNEK